MMIGRSSPLRTSTTLAKSLDSAESQRQQEDVGQRQGADPEPEEVRRIDHQHRAGLEAVDVQGADDDGRHGVAGDPEGDHRDVVPADAGVVRRLGGDDPLVGPLAEGPRRVLDAPSGAPVGHQGRDVAAGPGQGADPDPDQGRLDDQGEVLEEQPPGGDDVPDILLHRLDVDVVDLDEGLRDAEQADHDRHEVDPAHEADAPEGEPSLAGEGVHPDHAEPDPQGAGEDPLGQRFAGEAADEEEPHDRQHEVVPRGEHQRVFRDDRRAGRQGEDADVAADDRGGRRKADRDPRLAELGERVAVESGGDGRGRPGNVQQDRRPGAAVDARRSRCPPSGRGPR